MVSTRRFFGFAATLLVVGVIASGCAVASEEQGGPGADGNPVVIVQCAEDAPDCDDTVVTNAPDTATQGDTTTTEATSTTDTTATKQEMELQTVAVAFTTQDGQCDEVLTFEREIDASFDSLLAAFEGLVAGPTDQETASGSASFFSAETAAMVASVTFDQGLLVVDFEDLQSVVPNASTSCGSMALLAQLNATAFHFDSVERVRYEIEGSCDTFSNWLQRECTEYTRDGSQPAQP